MCRYEDLEEKVERGPSRPGIPQPLELPRAKAGFRKDRRHDREIPGEAKRQPIAEVFRDEIEPLDYHF